MGNNNSYERRDDTSLHRMVLRHDKDLYLGNGSPGLTTRMALQEGKMMASETKMNTIQMQLWGCIGLLISTLTGIIVVLVKH